MKTCEFCGNEFKSKSGNPDARFCGRECYNDAKRKPLNERFWEYVIIPPNLDGCWFWVGMTNSDGYGRINGGKEHNNKKLLATHVAWLLNTGELPPKGKCVCHKCDNPECVNPNHLFLGSHTDNLHDAINKGRLPGTKLSDDDIEFIREAYKNKVMNQPQLAVKFNCSPSHICKIINNRKRKILCQI